MVRDITRGDIIRLRDQLADTPMMANEWLKSLTGLFGYAVDLEWIAVNPIISVPRFPSTNDEGYRTWSEDDIDRFFAYHRPGTVPHTVATLMLSTGAADADVVRLGWQNIRGDRLIYRREKMRGKGGVEINIPILPALRKLLDALPRDRLTFLETEHGRPRVARQLSSHMARWTAKAGLPKGCTPHGLRKALARRLAEAGAPPQTIMSWLGHRTMAQAAHYSRAYDRARAADQGAELMAERPPENNVRRLKR